MKTGLKVGDIDPRAHKADWVTGEGTKRVETMLVAMKGDPNKEQDCFLDKFHGVNASKKKEAILERVQDEVDGLTGLYVDLIPCCLKG